MGSPRPSKAVGSARARHRSSGPPSTGFAARPGPAARRGRRSATGRGPAAGSGGTRSRRLRRIRGPQSCCYQSHYRGAQGRGRPPQPRLEGDGHKIHPDPSPPPDPPACPPSTRDPSVGEPLALAATSLEPSLPSAPCTVSRGGPGAAPTPGTCGPRCRCLHHLARGERGREYAPPGGERERRCAT